jgi:hypothetical protein
MLHGQDTALLRLVKTLRFREYEEAKEHAEKAFQDYKAAQQAYSQHIQLKIEACGSSLTY